MLAAVRAWIEIRDVGVTVLTELVSVDKSYITGDKGKHWFISAYCKRTVLNLNSKSRFDTNCPSLQLSRLV